MGGDSIDYTDRLHPSIQELACKTIQSIPGLFYGGIDFLIKNPEQSIDEQNLVVIEINQTPGLLLHPFVAFGAPINVSAKVMAAVQKELTGIMPNPAEHESHYRVGWDPLQVQFQIDGEVTGVGYRKWLRQCMLNLGLHGQAWNTRNGSVVGYVQGPSWRIGRLLVLCMRGPEGAKPSRIVSQALQETL